MREDLVLTGAPEPTASTPHVSRSRRARRTDVDGEVAAAQFFRTEHAAVDAVVPYLPSLRGRLRRTARVLDLGAGDGRICGRLIQAHGVPAANVTALELRESERPGLEAFGCQVIIGDFMRTELEAGAWDLVITNPPFSPHWLMTRFIERAWPLVAERGLLAIHGFADAFNKTTRARLHRVLNPRVLPITWRQNFTGGSGSWFDCSWYVCRRGDRTRWSTPLVRPRAHGQAVLPGME